MSKITLTRLGREFEGDTKGNVWRKSVVDPAAPKTLVRLEYNGREFFELASVGQYINPKRAYKRLLEREAKLREEKHNEKKHQKSIV